MTTSEGQLLLNNLLPPEMRKQLQDNGLHDDHDPPPVARLYTPYGKWSWLLALQDPEDPDKILCLADMGIGQPELGYISLSLLADYDIRGIPIQLDRSATFNKPLSSYANRATHSGKIEL